MTATVPSAPAQPATPGQALRWYADMTAEGVGGTPEGRAWSEQLRRWADELDAAPAAYSLPAEPAGPLWYPDGTRLDRLPPPEHLTRGANHPDHWVPAGGDYTWHGGMSWPRLLWTAASPLSTAPPVGTEAQ